MPRVLQPLLTRLSCAAALVLAGCASMSGIAPTAQVLSPAAMGLNDGPSATLLAPDGWQAWGDETLNRLVKQALAGNPTLGVAQARLQRAQANADAAQASEGLQVSGTFEAARQHYTANGLVPPPAAGHNFDSATLQAGASWEMDFFGRNSAALRAALGTQRAAAAEAQAARLLLASQVARTYVQLARLVAQREVSTRALAQRGEILGLIRQRVQAGLDTKVELRQGEGALPETRVQLESLNEQIAFTRHALAALTAQAPNALDALEPQLKTVQAVPVLSPVPAHVPADLLSRRPDVAAARWRVQAATDDVAATRAQFYPNVNLAAFAGLSSIGFDRLFKSASEQYGAGPAIHLPLFDAGRLRANLRGKSADLDAAVQTYNATVIDAVRDVADQISTLQSIARQQTEQSAAQAAAESAYEVSLQRYQAGLGTYLIVLNAEANVLNQRRAATDLQARMLDTQLALMRALGGGYSAEDSQHAATH